MPPRSPALPGRPSLGTDCWAVAVLMPVEVVLGFGSAFMVALSGPPWAVVVWLSMLVLAALTAAVVLFRRGYQISAAAEVLAVAVLLGTTAETWPHR
ncbi:hypothetical protein [Streptomyces sp. Agncl-13]|uniref:hypothetical protein n=1 Tax=Streptomyces sp. Agncl-13 TaxID=3400628 RepID=UPI003A8753FA